jgi:flagellar FliL protein
MSDKKPEAAPAAEKGDGHGAAPAAAGGGGGMKAMMPAIIAIVLAPAATWGVANFVLLPKFKASVAEAVAAGDPEAAAHGAKKADAPAAKADPHGAKKADPHGAKKADPHGAKKADPHGAKGGGGGEGYKFDNVVVNLSGTMGTRYLKASFLITGEKPDLAERFAEAKPQLTDVTLAVLSSLTLADLEESGSKNIIRERLIASYNQALGGKVAENLYFSEFVVQ